MLRRAHQARFHTGAHLCAGQEADEREGEVHGGAGAARGDQPVVRHDRVVPDLDIRGAVEGAGIAGGAPANEYPGGGQYPGGGANGGDIFIRGSHFFQQCQDARVTLQIAGARLAAGEHDHVEVTLQRLVQGGVGNDNRGPAAGDRAVGQPGGDYLDAGAPQQINEGDGLELFAARG